MPEDAFSVLLILESIWKVDAGMVKSAMVVCYNAAWKHEPVTLYIDDAEYMMPACAFAMLRQASEVLRQELCPS
jgi:hypothetical protein